MICAKCFEVMRSTYVLIQIVFNMHFSKILDYGATIFFFKKLDYVFALFTMIMIKIWVIVIK